MGGMESGCRVRVGEGSREAQLGPCVPGKQTLPPMVKECRECSLSSCASPGSGLSLGRGSTEKTDDYPQRWGPRQGPAGLLP